METISSGMLAVSFEPRMLSMRKCRDYDQGKRKCTAR